MGDRSTQPTWDPLVLAGQLHSVAKQSQLLMQRFATSQADATKVRPGTTLQWDFTDYEPWQVVLDPAGSSAEPGRAA